MTESKAVFEAIQTGDLERLRAVLAAAPMRAAARNEAGMTPLMIALYHRRPEAIEAILASGVAPDFFEATALGRLERIRELLAHDPELARAWTPDGFTALHLAAFFGQVEAAKILIDSGGDIAAVARNPMKVMPLHSAAAARQRAICVLLLDHGAPVNARQQEGWTALHSAANNGDIELLKLLLARGADPGLSNVGGRTALQLAEQKAHAEMVAILSRAHGAEDRRG